MPVPRDATMDLQESLLYKIIRCGCFIEEEGEKMSFNEIISMKGLRTGLTKIADRVEVGARFLVVRNSKPAFMLIPLNVAEKLRLFFVSFSAFSGSFFLYCNTHHAVVLCVR